MKVKSHYLYNTWCNMLSRCRNTNRWNYKFYGGKGIKVCDHWKEKGNGFYNFVNDMGDRPEDYQLDRIDNNGNYCKENCRWVNKHTQMGNTSNTKGIVGVSWMKSRNKYRARIKVSGKEIHLGLFVSIDDAINARDNAYKKLCIN